VLELYKNAYWNGETSITGTVLCNAIANFLARFADSNGYHSMYIS